MLLACTWKAVIGMGINIHEQNHSRHCSMHARLPEHILSYQKNANLVIGYTTKEGVVLVKHNHPLKNKKENAK